MHVCMYVWMDVCVCMYVCMHAYYIERGKYQLCCSSVAAPVCNVKSISFRIFVFILQHPVVLSLPPARPPSPPLPLRLCLCLSFSLSLSLSLSVSLSLYVCLYVCVCVYNIYIYNIYIYNIYIYNIYIYIYILPLHH